MNIFSKRFRDTLTLILCTEIVYFSTRSYPLDLYFSIDNVKIKPVDGHKHLGVTLSADCKWSKHMNNVVVKTSRQIAVLHKIKVKVSRNLLENIYMTLIMLDHLQSALRVTPRCL
jgi:hypothetical protein